MNEEEQHTVFFICRECGYIFEEDPSKMPVRCPQCGSEYTEMT